MPSFRSTMIRASAGSGKTHTLAQRFIDLVAAGVPPDRILALTFSRKAAAEFLERILQLQSEAVEASGDPRPLRHLIDNLHRLQLSTLDSFFTLLLKGFPYEFGIEGELQILDETEARKHFEAALAATLNGIRGSDLEAFELALDRASLQRTSQSVLADVRRLLAECREAFHQAPGPDLWGKSETIWSRPPEWSSGPGYEEAGELLVAAVAEARPDRAEFCRLQVAALQDSLHGTSPSGSAATFFKNLGEYCRGERDKLILNRVGVSLKAPGDEAARDLLHAFLRPRFQLAIEASRGLREVLAVFEEAYSRTVRRHGFLEFGDLTRALRGDLLPPGSPHPLEATDLGYRLDGWFDHWTFDEFQDTSPAQWAAVDPLVTEVLQDPGGDRTAFFVGDVKQAIYGWRGGDSRLFDRIEHLYGKSIDQQRLDDSWRSGQEILDAVNATFGDPAAAVAAGYSRQAADRWSGHWQDHGTRHPDRRAWSGVVVAEDPEEVETTVVDLVRSIREHRPGCRIGVLYRSNKRVNSTVDALRAAGIPAIREARVEPSNDNVAGKLLLSALRLLERPVDTLSLCHLRTTPLAASLNTVSPWVQSQLRILVREGPSAWADRFLESALPSVGRSELEAARITDLLALLDQADASGSRTPTALRTALEESSLYEAPGQTNVQVMTYHKAKGLSFDVAIVPLADRSSGHLYGESGLHIENDAATGLPRWILRDPGKECALNDPVLRAARERAEADNDFEELCGLYVAMTRPRYLLALVIPEQGGNSATKLVRATLKQVSAGEAAAAAPEVLPPACDEVDGKWIATTPVPLPDTTPERTARLRPRSPSGDRLSLRETGDRTARVAREEGIRIHRALAALTWIEPGTPVPTSLADWLTPGIRDTVFRNPEAPTLLWREQPFDCMVDDEWVSGVFDRVHLFLDNQGHPAGARIYDFKTAPADSAGRYRDQLLTYRRALARLTGLPENAITAYLVFGGTNAPLPVEPPEPPGRAGTCSAPPEPHR